MKKNLLALIALLAALALALVLCGCGGKEAAPAETTAATAPASLELTSFELTSSTWSSPNGATAHLSAAPNYHTDGHSAVFCVRLEGADVDNVPCEWTDGRWTASVDLNAADGYCYYLLITDEQGAVAEMTLNTPNLVTNESLINLETALNSYCQLMVEASDADGKKLTITAGTAQIQPPQIADDGARVTCTEAALVLLFNGQEADRKTLKLPEANADGLYELSIADNRFDIPAMEDDQQLTLQLEVTLSNGQTLTDANGVWHYIGGELLSAVG